MRGGGHRSPGAGPRALAEPQLRVPSAEAEIERLFAGWREELATCRKFAPAARNYATARLEADVGLRVNEVRMLDLDDVRWELGRFGKLNVRHGEGSTRKGPRPQLVPLINGADRICAGSSRTSGVSSVMTTAWRPAVPVRAQEPMSYSNRSIGWLHMRKARRTGPALATQAPMMFHALAPCLSSGAGREHAVNRDGKRRMVAVR